MITYYRAVRALPFVLGLMAAGCSREPQPEPIPSASQPDPAAQVQPSAAASDAVRARPLSTDLPSAMQGRFGLVAADCTTTRGDDKGLLTVTAKGLKFYESVARLAEPSENGPNRVSGRFAYQGEGMEWTRKATLELKGDGQVLVLEEFGEDAVPGPRTYTRCPA